MAYLKAYLFALVVLLIIDIPWIFFVMGKQYQSFAQESGKFEFVFRPLPGIITYMIMAIPFITFLHNQSLVNFALCGFVIYGVFAFTNCAIFADWPFRLVLLDTVWGAVLFTLTGLIIKKFGLNLG